MKRRLTYCVNLMSMKSFNPMSNPHLSTKLNIEEQGGENKAQMCISRLNRIFLP